MSYHFHICLFCHIIYECLGPHLKTETKRLNGARCCPECRHLNARAIKRLEVSCEVSSDDLSHTN